MGRKVKVLGEGSAENFSKFTKELRKLSIKYGVALQAVGGVQFIGVGGDEPA